MHKIEAILVRDPIDGFPRDKRLTAEKFEFEELKESILVINKSNRVLNEVPKSNIVSLRKCLVKQKELKSEQTSKSPTGVGKKSRTAKERP